jgi:serine/threonine protein kinase
MNGGKAIGMGGYGCVFNPALKCVGDKDRLPNHISKVFTRSKEAAIEFDVVKKISELDKQAKYYVPFTRLCRTALTKDPEDDAAVCVDSKINLAKKNYDQILIPYGGRDLTKYMPGTVQEFENSLIAMKNLFEALQFFAAHKFVHYDIKLENILYNESTKTMKFIDFGLSFLVKDMMRIIKTPPNERVEKDRIQYSILSFSIFNYGLDNQLIYYLDGGYADGLQLFQNKSVGNRIHEMKDNRAKNNRHFFRFATDDTDSSFTSLMADYEKLRKKESVEMLKGIDREKALMSVDTWAFGATLHDYLYQVATRGTPDVKARATEMIPYFRRMVNGMTRPLYFDRLSIDNASEMYNRILKDFHIESEVVPIRAPVADLMRVANANPAPAAVPPQSNCTLKDGTPGIKTANGRCVSLTSNTGRKLLKEQTKVLSKKATPVRVPSKKVTPVRVPSKKVTPARVPSKRATPVRVPSKRATPVKVIKVKKPAKVLSKKATPARVPSAKVPSKERIQSLSKGNCIQKNGLPGIIYPVTGNCVSLTADTGRKLLRLAKKGLYKLD